MKNERKLNIEVMRVVAMMLIVMGHYWYNMVKKSGTGTPFGADHAGEFVAAQALFSLAQIGVNCFVMITGYFLIHNVRFRYRGALDVVWQTLFYSLLVCALAVPLAGVVPGLVAPAASDWLWALEPLPVHHHWFVAKYLALLAVAPFVACMARQLTRRQYTVLMGVLFVLLYKPLYGETFGGGMTLGWFVFLFLTGAYLRLYPPRLKSWQVVAIAAVVLAYEVGDDVWEVLRDAKPGGLLQLRLNGNHSTTYLLAVAVFQWFAQTEMHGRMARMAASIAPCMLGVYLIHEHWLLRPAIWQHAVPELIGRPGIARCLAATLSIFALCTAVEALRRWLFRVCRVERATDFIARRIPQPLAD